MRMRKTTYITIILVVLGIGTFLIQPYLQHQLAQEKEAAITQALVDITGSIPARYAHMMLQTVSLQQGDCFVCSADGVPPNDSMKEGAVDDAFRHYNMLAYVISANKLENTTLTLNISLPSENDDAEVNRLQLEAKISPLTEHLYTAEFAFPRDKMPVGNVIHGTMWIQCGSGKEYLYTVYSYPGVVCPEILMNDSVSKEKE